MTYSIGNDSRSITCHVCGQISYDLRDVANLYCGHCHAFHISPAMTALYMDLTSAAERLVLLDQLGLAAQLLKARGILCTPLPQKAPT